MASDPDRLGDKRAATRDAEVWRRMADARQAKSDQPEPVAKYVCKTGTHGWVILYFDPAYVPECPCGPLKREEVES